MQEAIRSAAEQADIVVACFHWGKEYVKTPDDAQRRMARLACDAGADLVIGTHPHCVQPLEYYNGALIAYSLGNFIFDQMEHDCSRQGYLVRCGFSGGRLCSAEILPYEICDWCRPVPLDGPRGQAVLDEVLTLSGWQ